MTTSHSSNHIPILDGWRGISILMVLAAHLLPLGPKAWRLNESAGVIGMALFFTLSGFLITRFLLEHNSVSGFLIRRVFRIVPLAWLALVLSFALSSIPLSYYLPNLLFYANLPPQQLSDIASHYWSLCVEMQFYFGIALLFGLAGQRGLYALPLLCIAVTLNRVHSGALVDIVTSRRVDEILAGAWLALIYSGKLGELSLRLVSRQNVFLLLFALVVTSHPGTGFLNYFRPYVAALLVGASIYNAPTMLKSVLEGRVLRYLANVSFAVYVIHHLLIYSWLGEGEKLVKYLKRPLLFLATFALAHLSTFYFESRFIALGRRLANAVARRAKV